MDRKEFAALDKRIAAKAQQMWVDAGKPEGGSDRFTDNARALIGIMENPTAGTLDPEEAAEPVIEEASLLANLGESTSYSDRQGEDAQFPPPKDETTSAKK